MSDRTGLFDRYHLIRKLGSGAFGKVYLARDRYRYNDVAVKILPSLADDELQKFLTEARMMRLKHPHIIQLLDFGIEQQTPFLVMEYAPCGDLRQRHPRGSRMPLSTVLSYVTQLASALQAAHDDQIIHRDVKPENMLLNQQGQILLSDFGIATMVPSNTLDSAQSFFVGTIPYMAPEQAEGHPCLASDQYALAVVVYEWICGQRPFHGSPIEIAIQHRLDPPPSLCEQNQSISPEIEQVILTALAKDPSKRFVSVEAFAQAFEAASSTSFRAETVELAAPITLAQEIDVNYSTVRIDKPVHSETTHRKNRWEMHIGVTLIAAILLLFGSIIFSAISNNVPAIVTITPDSKVKQDSYVIHAIIGHADPAKHQVSLRQLTFSPQKQERLVTATGTTYLKAKRASGTIIFYNTSPSNLLVKVGTRIQSTNGIWVITDQSINVPPRLYNNFVTAVSVPAHAVSPGRSGNIGALAINQFCCNYRNMLMIKNLDPFSGGRDAQMHIFLQQSDIDGIVNKIQRTMSQQAINNIKRQIKPNEQLVSNPQCAIQSSVDQPIGEQWLNIASANVTVNAHCTGIAYNARGLQTLVRTLLMRKAVSDLGQGYTLVSTIAIKLHVTDVDLKNQFVTFNVRAYGTWYYQFNNRQKQILAKYLVNQTRATALRLLSSHAGIVKARVDIAGGGNLLPANPAQINIKISGAFFKDLPALST
jgi:serine/threonine protein kinase